MSIKSWFDDCEMKTWSVLLLQTRNTCGLRLQCLLCLSSLHSFVFNLMGFYFCYNRLKIQLDHLQSLLKVRKRRLRQNMVLGTISIIQSWDLAQFQALDPLRREALLRALNEDATKLIAEVGEGDREMRQLRDKLNECNQHFQNLTAAVTEQGRNHITL